MADNPDKKNLVYRTGQARRSAKDACAATACRIRTRIPNPADAWHHRRIQTVWRSGVGSLVKSLESEVANWPNVTVGPHQFGAREFRFRKGEVGHVHFWGDVDIPFPRAIRDVLVANGLARRHRWLPDSGWITFHLGGAGDMERACWLLRLSYLRYALKAESDPEGFLRQEAERMQLDEKLLTLLARFVPANTAA
jgi:Luciferase